MRFTMFDSIGQGLRDTQDKARAAAGTTPNAAIEDYLNLYVNRSVIIDADGRHGTWIRLVDHRTPYAFRYPDETEWLVPLLALKNHVKKEMRGNPTKVIADIVRSGIRIEKRPHPDKPGVTGEFVVWVEARPEPDL